VDGSGGVVWHESVDEAKVCHWIPPCRIKGHSLTFIDACWRFKETKQWMWAQWVVHFSSGNSHIKDKPCSGWSCTAVTPWNEECLNLLIHINHRLQLENCVWSWITNSMHWKQWWQRWNIPQFLPGEFYDCSHRNRKNTICKFVGIYWTNWSLVGQSQEFLLCAAYTSSLISVLLCVFLLQTVLLNSISPVYLFID